MRKFGYLSLFIFFISVVSVAVTLEEAKPSVAGFISDRLDRIDRLIQGCVDRQEIPGSVAILLKDGQIGYYRAFGWADLDTKKPMEKDALFRVASMSKLITTVAALQIYEKGHTIWARLWLMFYRSLRNQEFLSPGTRESRFLALNRPSRKFG